MTVDYDAPRRPQVETEDTALDDIAGRRGDPSVLDMDEGEKEAYELPGADLSDEELTVRVVPRQPDEFTCSRCFLVHHRSRLAAGNNGHSICTDCV